MPKRPPRSKLEAALDEALRELFPNEPVTVEMPVKIGRQTLFVDRVLKGQMLALEVDGLQHQVFTQFMHGDQDGFKASKARDQLKSNWLYENGYTEVRFAHNEKITAQTLRDKIVKAMNG